MKKTIAVDFDGVIHKYSKGWQSGAIYDEPIEGVHGALMTLMNDYAVYIFTTRNIQEVVAWMNSNFWGKGEMGFRTIIMPEDMKFWQGRELAVSNRKLPAIAYIDDRGIRFTNWKDTLNYF